jgi:hypothetical protein
MVFEIAIHCLPQEIDDLQQTLTILKRSSFYLSPEDKVKVTVLLNVNLINWDKSKLPKQYFENRFKTLENLTNSWAEVDFKIEDTKNILGNFSFYRELYQSTTSDFIINIDSDIIFSETLLANIINSAKILNESEKYFIITPEISKLWDNSWDILVNSKYINLLPSQDYIINDPYVDVINNIDPVLEKIDMFKFGMGWFTLINKNVFKLIELPKSMGHYGLDDTFIMICAGICKQNKIKIEQFILRNEIVRENFIYKSKIYNEFLNIIDKKDEFKTLAQNNFNQEIQNFINRIINNK